MSMSAAQSTYTKFANVTAWQPSKMMREPVSTAPGQPQPYAPQAWTTASTSTLSTAYPADVELKAKNILNTSLESEFDKWYLADQYARILMDRELVSKPEYFDTYHLKNSKRIRA
jgi:hypothetical protein